MEGEERRLESVKCGEWRVERGEREGKGGGERREEGGESERVKSEGWRE